MLSATLQHCNTARALRRALCKVRCVLLMELDYPMNDWYLVIVLLEHDHFTELQHVSTHASLYMLLGASESAFAL